MIPDDAILALLAPVAGERILDLACGDGTLAVRLHTLGCHVVAVGDAAGVEAARRRGLEAHVMSPHDLGFEADFDAVVADGILTRSPHPHDVLAGIWRALRPGGRFVGTCLAGAAGFRFVADKPARF